MNSINLVQQSKQKFKNYSKFKSMSFLRDWD